MAFLIKNRFISKLVSILLLTYLFLIVFGLFFSDHLIFLPRASSYQDSNDLIKISTITASNTESTHRIVARHIINADAKYTLIYSHGNAVDIGGLTQIQSKFINHGYSMIIYDYSGYGLSQGRPSEQQVYNDVQAVYDYSIDNIKLKPEQIISYGHSLGAAVATDLAFKNPVAGLILENPFTTAFRVKTVYPLVPFDKFASIDKIDKIEAPVLIMHSKNDYVIPFWHAEELFAKAKQPKQSLWFENAGHTNITHEEILWPNLDLFTNTKI